MISILMLRNHRVNVAAQVSGPKGAAAAAADDPTDAAAAVGVAHGRVVSSLMRKHLVGVVVPIALQLKRRLEAARHPLLGGLMLALASLLADHKHEVPNQMYNLTQPRSFETFEDGMTCESWMRLMLGCTI